MAITRETIIDQVELTRFDEVRVRIALLLMEDGKEIDCKWHRTSVPLGSDVAAQLGYVNTHLEQTGVPCLTDADVADVVAYFQLYSDRRVKE